LTGARLTIDGGITLSPGGAVPANETITFAGTGGTLALSDDVAGTDVAGAIYGFSPPDTIDLADVPYDSNGTAELSSDPNNNSHQAIEVDENGVSYYLDIDQDQYFLAPPQFDLNPDASGNGAVGNLHRRRQPWHVPQCARVPHDLSGHGARRAAGPRTLLRAAP